MNKDILGLRQNGDTVVGFACYHGGKGRDKMKSLREEVKRRIAEGGPSLVRREVTDSSLINEIVWDLEWHFSAHITGILCDQWCAVTAETYDEKLKVLMQCDDVLDGFAGTWKVFADRLEKVEK